MKPSREKEDPFISLETDAIRRHTRTEFRSLTPRTKVEQNKTLGPLLCLSLWFSKVVYMNLRVNFLVLILFMELVSQLHTCGIVYFVTLNTFFSSPLRTYFYDMNFRSPFKQSHRILQIHFSQYEYFFSLMEPTNLYCSAHSPCILFSIPLVLWCFTPQAFWGAHRQVPR